MLIRLANSSLAESPPPEPCPTNEEMGQAALDFVRRFDLKIVLGDFERELRELAAGEHRAEAPRVRVMPCAKME